MGGCTGHKAVIHGNKKKNFLKELATVSLEGIKGFHIHY